METSAIILDLDGVITDTRRLHLLAWGEVFPGLTEADYLKHIDGKPRADGIRCYLASQDQHPNQAEINQIAAAKNKAFLNLLQHEGPVVFPDALEAITTWFKMELPMAVVSSSRNCRRVLDRAGLTHYFQTIVDGEVGAELGLPGKPAPDYFLEAARRLMLDPADCVVIEDAVAGIQSARAGGFGRVVGIGRGRGRHSRLLIEHGATEVISALNEFQLAAPEHGMETWSLIFDEWEPREEKFREALCTLGNGYFATRGAAEEARASEHHYPGTYLAGGYDCLSSDISGHQIHNEDLVNWPDWTLITFRHQGGEWLDLKSMHLLEYRQELNLKRGSLERRMRFRDRDDRETELCVRRFVSMANPHQAAIKWSLKPLNWEGPIEVRSLIDGAVENTGVERYRQLASKHLKVIELGEQDEIIWLSARTLQSELLMTISARTRLSCEASGAVLKQQTYRDEACIGTRSGSASGENYLTT
jgi:beta-phosphoglucomutase family hydrolase